MSTLSFDADIIVRLGAAPKGIYVVTYEALPFTVNQERTWHHMKRHKMVKEWREAFCWLARKEKIPPLQSVHVHCLSHLKRMNRDTASELPAQKASLDGVVDAGVLEDDRPPFVQTITFHPPRKHSKNMMSLILVEA